MVSAGWKVIPGNLESFQKLFEDYGKWCRTIDNIISEEISEFNNLDIKLFLNSALHKRGYIFMYFNELEKLSLLNSEKLINEVFYFKYSKKEFSPISRIIHMILYYKIATNKNPSPRSIFWAIGFLRTLYLSF